MKHSKSLKLVLPILLILLMGIGIFSGCLGNLTTPPPTVPDSTSGDEEVLLRTTYKEINLDEGNFSIEICSLNQYGLNASGFNYTYYDSEGVEITELSNFVGIPFDVVPSTLIGTPGSPTEVNNIPLYFNEVENYFIANPDVKQISCTINLIGTDSLGNEITELIMSNIPIIESGVEHQEVNANIQTTPNPPTGEVPLTVSFDAGASTTEDARGVAKYCWHFGDGSHGTCFDCSCPSELECPMHTYEEPGTYIATLCVWDYNDNLDCAAVVVTVNAIQMNMTITANPATIAPKETSTISAYLTDQYDNPIPDGTKVTFYTTDGTLSAVFADTVGGIATVDLTLNEPVIATVTAVCDDASGSIIVRAVELGITVTADPVTISPGDFSTISAYLVDTFGEPVPDGTTVTFSTSEGNLSSNFAVTIAGIATVELQLSRITTAIVTANYGTVSGSTMVTCTDGPIAIIENDTDDQISPIEITANSDCPYTITFNAYKSIPGTAPPLTYEWTMTHPDGTVEDLGTAVVTAPYVFDACGIYVITLTVEDSCTVPCPHSDTATMRIIVTNPEGPTAIITSSEPITGSTINIIANSDCAYPVTFFGDKSTTTAICGDITGWSWTIVEPDSTTTDDTTSGMMMTYSFDECGTYVVALEVIDGCGRTASTFVTVIVSEPTGPTAVITSSEPIVNSAITITANSDCAYPITFYGNESSTIVECGEITGYSWSMIDPDGNTVTGLPTTVSMTHNFNDCGPYALTLTVTDACGNSDSESLTVIVQEPTGPTALITSSEPIVSSTITITGNSDCAYPITFYGNESSTIVECGEITGYSWSMIDPNGDPVTTGFTPDAVSVSLTYNFDLCGPYALTLTVTDACGNTDSESLTVIVQEPTGPTAVITSSEPIVSSTITITGNSDCAYPITFYGDESSTIIACGSITGYSWSMIDPDGNTVTGLPTTVSMTHNFNDCGPYALTLTVTDACGNTDSESLTVIVQEPTGPTAVITSSEPIVSSTITITANSDCAYPITFYGNESSTIIACGSITGYSWSMIDPDGNTVTGLPTTVSMTHNFNDCGPYALTLTVTDACGNTDSESLTVIVQEPTGPTAVITSSEPIVSSTITITGNSDCAYPITFYGDESSTIIACGSITGYSWSMIDPDGNTVTGLPTTVSMTHNFNDCGPYALTLTVTDACGNTDSESLTVIVQEPTGPTAVITGSPGNIEACSGCPYPAVFNGGSSTPGAACGGLTYAWSIARPTGAADFGTKDAATASYAFEVCGTYTITLEVTDGCNNTDSTSVTLKVTEPAKPDADIANTESSASPIEITACSGCPYTIGFDGTGSTNNTACGDLTYAWTIVTPTTTVDSGSASIISYNFTEFGTHTVTLLVTDGCGNTDSEMIVVVVNDCCLTAAFSYTPSSPVLEDELIQFDASGSISDCGCGVVNYDWDWDYTAPNFDDDGTGETTTHAYASAETYTVALRVTDACGQTALATMDVVVEAPAAPLAAIDVSKDGLSVNVSGIDSTTGCPGGWLSYAWDFDLDNPGTITGTGMDSSHTYSGAGVYTIQLTVTDACSKSSTATVDVNLYAPATPLAAIDASVDGLSVNVSGADSTTGCPGGWLSYAWDFDLDNPGTITGTGMDSSHTYSGAGVYTIQLTVTDACSKSSTATVDVNVTAPAAPLAAIDVSKDGLSVNVSGIDSTTGCPGGWLSYAWDFDLDNPGTITGTGMDSSHTYSGAGVYTIQLTVTDACSKSSTATVDVNLYAPATPLAAIDASVDGLSVNVSGADSTTGCPGGWLSYAWDFDLDNPGTITGTGMDSSHTYSGAGVYTIQLTVTDACSKSSTATVDVNVTAPAAPLAAIDVSKDGLSVNVSGIDSTTGCPGGWLSYAWDFDLDNPGTITGTGMDSSHTYSGAGVYTIQLTVTDACSKSSTATVDVNLYAPATPLAAIDASVDGLSVNVSGADSTTGCPGGWLSYAWDFDLDNPGTITGTGMDSSHTYSGAGVYTIQLTVTDACSKSSTATVDVNVPPPANPVAVINITSIVAGLVNVDGSNSTTGCTTAGLTYAWNWGDGTTAGSGISTTHVYNTGLWTITLVVTDNCGKNSTATAQVIIP